MRVTVEDGQVLDAEYRVEAGGECLALIMESRSGASGSRPPRNPDYNQALSVLLTRLARLDAVLASALVDSRKTRDARVPEEQRRLIDAPVRLAEVSDMEAFRRRLGTAQSKVAQAPDATRGGVRPGDRAMLLRQHEDRGLVASGTFISGLYQDEHFDGSRRMTHTATSNGTPLLTPRTAFRPSC